MEQKLFYILDYDFNLLPEALRDFPYELWPVLDGLYLLAIAQEDAKNVTAYIDKYPYIPKIYGPSEITDDIKSALGAFSFEPYAVSGILRMQEEPLALTGAGVLLAIIDSGIQYDLPAFRDENGQTRIVSLWDQTLEGDKGTRTEGVPYGRVFPEDEINEALKNNNPYEIIPSNDTSGHGTIVASVAAASRQADGERGAAYGCRFVVVKLRRAPAYLTEYYGIENDIECYAEHDILMALQYVQQFQKSFNTPLVILNTLVSSQGNHTGMSLLPIMLGRIGQLRNQIVVAAAGNEGEAAGHYEGRFGGSNEPGGQIVELLVGEGEESFVMEIWGRPPAVFSVGLVSPAGEQVGSAPYRPGQSYRYAFLYSQTVATIDYVATDQASGQELILIRLEKPLAGIWQIRVIPYVSYQESIFDIWLPIRTFLAGDTRFLRPNPEITITDPACGVGVISVGAYQSDTGSFYQKSGRGYTSDGAIKPDLIAPGVNISTPFGSRSGTSLAAAIVAGACAQYLEWAVIRKNDMFVNTAVVKNALIRGAARSDSPVYPNPLYGYGKLDLEKTFELIAGIV